jgi:hypothetical protein
MNLARLHAEILAPADCSRDLRGRLWALFAASYDSVDRPRFESDLDGKSHVILLRDDDGQAQGFSTLTRMEAAVDGQPVRALFSGDTIIDPRFWGEQALVRGWCRVAAEELRSAGDTPLYWFLISKGYRTYLYLPLFYREFWPRHERATPGEAQRVLDGLATARFGPAYCPETGLIRFEESLGQLKPELAGVPERRQLDPNVAFFLKKNPGYAEGVELACLARLSIDNTRSLGRRIFEAELALAHA